MKHPKTPPEFELINIKRTTKVRFDRLLK